MKADGAYSVIVGASAFTPVPVSGLVSMAQAGLPVRCARDQLAVLGLEHGVRDLEHIEDSHVDVIGEVGQYA
jgi:hypothetical protein